MTKTKKQLRAEAVERLRANEPDNIYLAIHQAIGWSGDALHTDEEWRDALIDLLTDDDANDDSAHESDVRTASVDANDAKVSTMPLNMPSEIRWHYTDGGEYTQELTGDSRDKLEADVRKHYAYSTTTLMYPPSANKTTDMLRALPVDTVIGWLDRQAAITEREVEHDLMKAGRMAVEVERERIEELTAERDELRGKMEAEHSLRLHWKAQTEELTDERVKLRSQICKLEDDLVRTSDECDNWKANCEDWKKHARAAENACYETMLERDHYRSKFGKCLDYADAIHALMDDEGLA